MTEHDAERRLESAADGRYAVLASARRAGVKLDADEPAWDYDRAEVTYTLTFVVPHRQTVGIVTAKLEDIAREWWNFYEKEWTG